MHTERINRIAFLHECIKLNRKFDYLFTSTRKSKRCKAAYLNPYKRCFLFPIKRAPACNAGDRNELFNRDCKAECDDDDILFT